MTYDLQRVRSDFPILGREIRPGVKLIYLDSTATAQKPTVVMQAMDAFYQRSNANIHRGVHALAEEATALYENARGRVAGFIHAAASHEVIFTRNTTEAINLVARTWAWTMLKPGDLIILSEMEHHSNLVPWQMVAAEKNLQLEFIPVTDDGMLDLNVYGALLARGPRLVAFTHMSNVLGTITPAGEIVRMAHDAGAVTLIDGAQSVPHLGIDVQDLDVDFLAFSAHKMCGPTGIGVLYGKSALLESMPPFLGGGDMIREVRLRSFRPNSLPHKFEAGTPAIAEAVGFAAAVDYLGQLGMKQIAEHEHAIVEYAMERLEEIPGIKILGPTADQRGGVTSFTLDGVHPHDVAQILDRSGIAVRAGHHCAQPLHERMGISASTRASFFVYSSREEVDALMDALNNVKNIFA